MERNMIMINKENIELQPIGLDELPQFTTKIQEAFAIAVKEKFGFDEPIPSTQEVLSSFQKTGSATYNIMADGKCVGGAMLIIDENTQHNSLELFFISPERHSHGLGLAAWQAIEAKYPDTVVWETITPYFEQRNIHFYVNKCGFHIVEFFNKYHTDPNIFCPEDANGEMVPGTDAFFRFEKKMK